MPATAANRVDMRSTLFLALCSIVMMLTGCSGEPPMVVALTPLAVEVEGLPLGGFELTATGQDVDFDFDGTAQINFDPAQGYALYLQDGDSYNGVTFVLPEAILPGTYELADADGARSFTMSIARPGAMITQDPMTPDDDFPLRVYGEEIRGTLTLTSVDPFTGAFYFGAVDEGVVRTARGQFRAIPRPNPAP